MWSKRTAMDSAARDRGIRTTLWIEGTANLIVLIVKTITGLTTGSFAILADAVHSLADLGRNGLALAAAALLVLCAGPVLRALKSIWKYRRLTGSLTTKIRRPA